MSFYNNMDNDYNHKDNASSSTTSSTAGSSSTGNYINHISANTTTTTSSGGGDTTCSVSPVTNQLPHKADSKNANLIEQLVQQHQFMQSNKPTLQRHQMFDSLLHASGRQQDSNNSPTIQSKFQQQQQQHRFGTLNQQSTFGNNNNNSNCQYLDLNNQQTTSQNINATTAYLVQTPNGNALLIPPQTALNPTNHFIQTNANQQQTNTISLNRNNSTASNPYGITTIPYQQAASLLNDQNTTMISGNGHSLNGLLPNSPSVTSGNCFARPESTTSTNVYQTIDATEKNGYLYPVESGYDSSTFYHNTNSTTINNRSFNTASRNKYKLNYQQHLQQQLMQQQLHHNQSQFTKLLENQNTLHSNQNNTNSNYFTSPTLSSESNRRNLVNDTSFDRMKYQLTKKLKGYCSWKVLAFLFLFLIANLLTFTVYLAVMRTYNLNWDLKDSQASRRLGRDKSLPPIIHSIGNNIKASVNQNEIYNIQMHIYSSIHVKFNLSMSRDSNIGIYMAKNGLPTLTKFKYFETFNGKSLQAADLVEKRVINSGSGNLVNTAFVHHLDQGVWFISLFNENNQPIEFEFRTEYYESDNSRCPINCHGKGDCQNGVCVCYTGFSGNDCSERSCPVVCNGNGVFQDGKCKCNFGYHGSECQLSRTECKVQNCNDNGECVQGKCECRFGFTGESCETLACPIPDCSNNGVCLNGECKCFSNFTGSDCATAVPSLASICSNNGNFDYETKSCICFSGWSGADCSRNENCLDKMCSACKNGWSGMNCMTVEPLKCDIRCNQHGICVNGTCNCSPGYQGRNCDINNCPKGCSSNGICEKSKSQYTKYQCMCNHGWTGQACDVQVELFCNDDIDNDNDGLTDCMDSECCGFDSCKLSSACQTSPEPKDRLLRKQPPSLSATFFEKMRFLIEDNSVQSFANSNSFRERINLFNKSQVSVIRGQVLFKNGQPLIGVKVSSVSNSAFGYTLTRNNGIFDLMVNGGGSVELEFKRKDLKLKRISMIAVWNQFVNVDTIKMFLLDDQEAESVNLPCESLLHNSSILSPIVKTSWKEIRTYYYDNSAILPDSGIVRNELSLIDSDLKLVYTSNQAAGFSSTIFILLTKSTIPETLKQVHVNIIVEGVLHKQRLDAYPSQSFEYSWDRRNAYEQRVYGVTSAKVSVGYEYENCEFIYWKTTVVKLAGYDLGSSEIGNWNIDVHHRLNSQQGILHKGDGTTIYLKDIQKQIEIVAGQQNKKRPIECRGSQCKGYGSEAVRFYSPNSLSINKDGLIFIGDHNYVWMLNNSGVPSRVLTLKIDQPYKYFITSEQATGKLLISDSINKKLLRLKSTEQPINLKQNADVSETFCFEKPNHYAPECSRAKSLQNPRGFAYDRDESMYLIDGNKIKVITRNGFMRTLIGGETEKLYAYKPMGCAHSYDSKEMRFYWPSVIKVNPVDNLAYILDGNMIYKITEFKTVEVVLGVPYGCDSNEFTQLEHAVDMDFNSEGDLFILINDGLLTKRINLLRSSGEFEVFYDGTSKENSFGEYYSFNNPVAIAVHPNRSVYILDQSDNVLYHIKNSIEKDEYTNSYTIVSPETRETYVFNRFGLHLSTIDLLTNLPKFNFTYSGNALYGKLVSIVNQHKVLLNIKRDFHGRAQLMQTSSEFNIRVKLNNFNMLKSLVTSDDRSYSFKYLSNTGLLISSSDLNGKVTLFNYESNGKVKKIIEPNNMPTTINYFINETGICTEMNKANLYTETWITNGTSTRIYKNGKLETLMETNQFNLNIRSMANEADYNRFQSYYKSILNFQTPQTRKLTSQRKFNFISLKSRRNSETTYNKKKAVLAT